jgi:hypothetical protein
MARTRTFVASPTQADPDPIQAAGFQVAPLKRSGQSEFDAKREVDIMLQGDASHDTDLAWYFYSRIPELRYIARYVANSLSQARLFVGRVGADPFNPVRVDGGPAVALLEQFAGGFEGQSELLDRLGLHLTVAGDSVLAGPWDQRVTPDHPFDHMRIYSTSEMVSRNGEVYRRAIASQKDVPLPKGVAAFRIWRPHPRRWERADSPVLSSFTVLREIDLLDQHVHASAISRLAGAGLLLLPDEITFPSDEVETDGIEIDPFIRHLTEVMSIAIKNRDSAAAVVPIMLRGTTEAIAAIKHLTFTTEFSDKVPELRNVALRRLALGMDVPPEVLLGMSESTQWSAWQTDESTVRLHTVPLLQVIVNSITTAWFRPALRKMRDSGLTEKEINELTIWFDISNLQIQPNKIEQAADLYSVMGVGLDTYLLAAGFTTADKPTSEELEFQILIDLIKTNPGMAAYAINALTEKGYVKLPTAVDPVEEAVKQAEEAAKLAKDIADEGGGPGSLPGQRSQDKQGQAPTAPDPNNPDPDNNEVK